MNVIAVFFPSSYLYQQNIIMLIINLSLSHSVTHYSTGVTLCSLSCVAGFLLLLLSLLEQMLLLLLSINACFFLFQRIPCALFRRFTSPVDNTCPCKAVLCMSQHSLHARASEKQRKRAIELNARAVSSSEYPFSTHLCTCRIIYLHNVSSSILLLIVIIVKRLM